MSQDSTRASLLSRLRNGSDTEAWREFDEQYRDLLRRYCARSGLQAADTEDVCQVVFAALVRVLPEFHFDPERGRFRSYLGRMVANAIRQQRTRGGRVIGNLENSVLELVGTPRGEPVEDAWEEEWSNHHLRRALATLRRQTQAGTMEAFERLLAGKSVAEVATEFGMTSDAVHKVKQRIGERLREEVERQVREEELEDGGANSPGT